MALRSRAIRSRFIGALIDSGNVSYAAREAGIGLRTAYDYRDRHSRFAAEWDAALAANAEMRVKTGRDVLRLKTIEEVW